MCTIYHCCLNTLNIPQSCSIFRTRFLNFILFFPFYCNNLTTIAMCDTCTRTACCLISLAICTMTIKLTLNLRGLSFLLHYTSVEGSLRWRPAGRVVAGCQVCRHTWQPRLSPSMSHLPHSTLLLRRVMSPSTGRTWQECQRDVADWNSTRLRPQQKTAIIHAHIMDIPSNLCFFITQILSHAGVFSNMVIRLFLLVIVAQQC